MVRKGPLSATNPNFFVHAVLNQRSVDYHRRLPSAAAKATKDMTREAMRKEGVDVGLPCAMPVLSRMHTDRTVRTQQQAVADDPPLSNSISYGWQATLGRRLRSLGGGIGGLTGDAWAQA